MTEPDPKPSSPRRRRRRRRPAPRRKKPEPKDDSPRPVAPTKAETNQLPPFQGLTASQIEVPSTPRECRAAADALTAASVAGFDTEAKPTFKAGESSGALNDVLDRLTYIIEHEHKVKSDIKSALMYPIIVVVFLVIAFFVELQSYPHYLLQKTTH